MADTQADPILGPDLARFPNTRLRAAASDGPASPPRTSPADANLPTDPDTCRICRGEGTPEEPLFYPCKCSGSIKYVHQDCLMEWLSHSQKKHCELCKTPFRFTKLYAPDMPKALPFHIFVSHMAKYLFRNVLVWLRATLVTSVWLGWLPYLMRSVWSFLFWISDEGLGGGAGLFGRQNGVSGASTDALFVTSYGTTVCPSSPLFAATTTVATLGGMTDGLPLDSLQILKSLYNFNLTSADPLYSTILRLLFGSVGLGERSAPTVSDTTSSAIEKAVAAVKGHPSLLSDVSFLRNLTRHASINRAVIAILEGQIITILVIVCFILIILVRDYVVQQQPDIMRAAAFAPIDNGVPQLAREEPAIVPDRDDHAVPPQQEPVEDVGNGRNTRVAEPHGSNSEPREEDLFHTPFTAPHASDSTESSSESMATPFRSNVRPYPGPDPERAGRDPTGGEHATVHEYLTIYREAGGDPDKIKRIAREMNMEGKMDYWIRLTQVRLDRGKAIDDESSGAGDFTESAAEMSTAAQAGTSAASRGSDQSDWTWAEEQPAWNSRDRKGKGRLNDDEVGDADPSIFAGNPLRPRANTDGPKPNDAFNPLANNNWSFTDLPGEHSKASTDHQMPPNLQQSSQDSSSHYLTHAPINTGEGGPSDAVIQPPYVPTSRDEEEAQYTQPPHESLPDPDPRAIHGDVQGPEEAPVRQATDVQPPRRQQHGLFNRVADFMWRGIDTIDPAELAAVDFLDGFADNEEDVLGVAIQDDALADDLEQDREVAEAAAAAGLDPEAIEDAEDLEGILELLGMRGPVAGLFQNAIFCAFLVSITIFLGIFVPYNIGRVTVWTLANPMRPARMLFSLSKFIQDCAVVFVGAASCLVSLAIQTVSWLASFTAITNYFSTATISSWAMTLDACDRIRASFMTDVPIISASEVRNFSAISHEALLAIRGHLQATFSALAQAAAFIFDGDYSVKASEALATVTSLSAVVWERLKDLPELAVNPSSWVINLSVPEPNTTVNPELAYWDGTDRFWAIISGYVAMSLMAGLYLRRGTPFSSSQTAQEWEAALIDGLNQASGVMKVILIIGIEMLVFPLYCGMLLDIALLPLFEDTSIRSRLLFTVNFPVTSVFVHWFVGTGYMFHFALFVSMCRKIMRKGVLYFIRDPDDPEFHPVRDVLERSVTTQLRKILFSAFVYGALVVVCLGGVVWGLALSLPSVLPIHYSSNEPVLEFPIDLLFYNFLMPLAVKFFRPSDGLHAMYTWWFRKCARVLRITWFLFGERRVDEEGHLIVSEWSPYHGAPWWKTLFLELNVSGEVVPKTWSDTFEGGTAKPISTIPTEEAAEMDYKKLHLVETGQLIPDGRFVRTPASDQVKIPKGQRVFLDVDQNNKRTDGREFDLYDTKQYQFVYVPPHFRARIFLFILFIWIFAATTGVGLTIVPLVFGRQVFKLLIPKHIRTNDIYAFSIGVYVLSSAGYVLLHLRSIYHSTATWVSATVRSAYNREIVQRISGVALHISRVVYAYFFLFVVFPLMVASLMELYAVIPLHEFMYSGLLAGDNSVAVGPGKAMDLNPRHTVRVIQGWTVGLLYLKLSSRIIVTWFNNTRLATAVRAVLRRGWLDPDLAVLTRAFVIPGLVLWAMAIVTPLLFARFTVANGLAEAIVRSSGAALSKEIPDQPLHEAYLVLIYRLSFPAIALGVVASLTLWSLVGVFRSWRIRIRDEAYLIGERLHNFGIVNGPPKTRGAWRAGGSRL